MKEKKDKEKSIIPARVWPDIPEELKKECKWYRVLRDWLCEIVPGGDINQYCAIGLRRSYDHEFNIAEIEAVLYSHTYRYSIVASEERLYVNVEMRKPIAGFGGGGKMDYEFERNELFDGKFSARNWEFVKNEILRYEMVKIVKQARTAYPL